MRALLAAAAITATLVTAACVTSGTVDTSHKDIGGKTIHLTEWRDIKPYQLRINVADAAMGAAIHEAQQRIRDNDVLNQQAKFDRGWIFVEYLIDPGLHYDALTVRRLKSEAASKQRIQGAFSNRRLVYEDSVQIEQRGRQIGWAHLIRNPNNEELTCIYAWTAILSPGKVVQDKFDDVYDTTVELLDCSMVSPFAGVVGFLSGLKVVKPEYNRAAMAE